MRAEHRQMTVTDRVWGFILALLILCAWVLSATAIGGCSTIGPETRLTEASVSGYVLLSDGAGNLYRVDLATGYVAGDSSSTLHVEAARVDLGAVVGEHRIGIGVERIGETPHRVTVTWNGLTWSTELGGQQVVEELQPGLVE